MRRETLAMALGLTLVGCALPPPPTSSDDDELGGVDAGASDDGDDDTSVIDAGPRPDSRPPGGNELTHSTSNLVVPDNSVACQNDDGSTAENSYYRVFVLSEFDISGSFVVDAVEFGVDQADGGGDNRQSVDVRLHTLDGTLDTNNLTQLASTRVTVPDVAATLLRAEFNSVTVPAGSTLVVEVRSPDGDNGNDAFFIGSNPGGQTGPSYIRAPQCDDNQPTDLADLDFADMHIVMTVFGKS